jgi:hypothetical protein
MNDTINRTEQAQSIFEDALSSVRKPRGRLKFVNGELENKILEDLAGIGYSERGAKGVLTRMINAGVEAGELAAEAPEAETAEERGPKKIDVAREEFNRRIKRLNTTAMQARTFRAQVISAIEEKTGVNTQTAAAMYNTCKTEAEEAGLIAHGRLGRGGQPVDLSQPWAVANERGTPVASYGTKKAALAAAGANQTVAKTADLVPNG